MFYEADAWDASAAWYDAEVAENERNGDGAPWSSTPHYERCDENPNPNPNPNPPLGCTRAPPP